MTEFDDEALKHQARLLRELLDRFLGTAAEEPGDRLIDRLEQHLGERPSSLPVVAAMWAGHEQADVQLALERWLEDQGLTAQIIGTPHPMRRHQSLAELIEMARHDSALVAGPRTGCTSPSPPTTPTPASPSASTSSAATSPLAMLLRGPDPQSVRTGVQLEILSADPDVAGEIVAELRRLAVELSPCADRS